MHRTAGRGPGGGVVPPEIPRMKGRLRRPYFFYSAGLFGEAVAQQDAFKDNMAKVDEFLEKGEALAASEALALLEVSFHGTDEQTKEEVRTEAASR